MSVLHVQKAPYENVYKISLEDVTTFLSPITGNAEFNLDTFTKAVNLIRGRAFFALENDTNINYFEPNEDFYSRLLNLLLIPVVTTSLWRTAFNSYNFFTCQAELNSSKKLKQNPQLERINDLVNKKVEDLRWVKTLDEILKECEISIDLKVRAAMTRYNVLESKGRFIDHRRRDYDPNLERKIALKKKNIRFLSNISLKLISVACEDNHQLIKNKEINRIKEDIYHNLKQFV